MAPSRPGGRPPCFYLPPSQRRQTSPQSWLSRDRCSSYRISTLYCTIAQLLALFREMLKLLFVQITSRQNHKFTYPRLLRYLCIVYFWELWPSALLPLRSPGRCDPCPWRGGGMPSPHKSIEAGLIDGLSFWSTHDNYTFSAILTLTLSQKELFCLHLPFLLFSRQMFRH